MNTPIFDFVQDYLRAQPVRLHMPGHKGQPQLGCEALDITEIPGADSLYEASGIIAESEKNAGEQFGADTFYSTEGSSHCIRAMLYLALLWAKRQGRAPRILSARNAHRSFLSAVALLDLQVGWMPSGELLSCAVSLERTEAAIRRVKPAALFITSPDYLGNTAPIAELALLCKRYGVLLLVDNAHGSYLKFLPRSLHPMDLGADMCCDSAHKTLPALTGAAYLHVNRAAPPLLRENARRALAVFGSTSPSYLILQSLDLTNRALCTLPERLAALLPELTALKARLRERGWQLLGDEPMKLTLRCKRFGYTGTELSALLAAQGIICEFADKDYLVCMFSADTALLELARLEQTLCSVPQREPISEQPPALPHPWQKLTPRQALLAPRELLPLSECLGRVLASTDVSCPPAVPILVCGEIIDTAAQQCMAYYGVTHCSVVIES